MEAVQANRVRASITLVWWVMSTRTRCSQDEGWGASRERQRGTGWWLRRAILRR